MLSRPDGRRFRPTSAAYGGIAAGFVAEPWEYLRKVFTKLGIGSRRELREALPAVARDPRA